VTKYAYALHLKSLVGDTVVLWGWKQPAKSAAFWIQPYKIAGNYSWRYRL